MFRLIKGILFTSISVMIFLAGSSLAQEPTIVESPDNPACPPVAWMCPNVKDEGVDEHNRHTYTLSASTLPVKGTVSGRPVPIYIVSGIETEDNTLLTTGNRETDVQYCLATQQQVDTRTDPLTKLINLFGYEIRYFDSTNPFYSQENGTASIRVRPQSENEESHTFFLMWPLETEVVGGEGGENQTSGQTNSPKYATFRFQGQPAACLSFRADPFGRAYNQQLKPVPGTVVTLFNSETEQQYAAPGLPNPVTTREDGVFNFNIEPGTTFLRTNLQNNVDVHANYALAYTAPYVYGEPIVETLEKAEQRDIPVIGGAVPQLKLMNYGHVQLGNQSRIEGNASWPLTIVNIMQGQKSIAQQQSSKFGRFSFLINNNQISPTEQLTIRLTEVDLVTDATQPAPGGATVEETFDPIPRYLDGYAYDAAGNLLPFATVQVHLVQSDAVYYQTKADGNAFFTIGPRQLPILPYYLTYTPANTTPSISSSRKVSTPEFAKENEAYHQQNNINIMAATKNGRAVDPGSVLENAQAGGSGQDSTVSTDERARQQQQAAEVAAAAEKARQRNVTMFLLIVSFIFVGGGVVLYLKKRGGMDFTRSGSGDVGNEAAMREQKDDLRSKDVPELEV